MIFPAIDTSGKSGGITLAEGDLRAFQSLGSTPIAGGAFSAQLVPTLSGLLRQRGLAAADLGGLVAVSGPGSFTGLRVGLSAVKGLAEALNVPIATVSVLEMLAALSPQSGKIAVALDAGRAEVFFGLYELGLYELSGGHTSSASTFRASMLREQLLSLHEFTHELQSARPACLITSEPSLADVGTEARVHVQTVERPGSESAARLGLRKLLDGDTISVEALDANYIRRSDAEMFSSADAKPKQAQ